MISPRQFNKHFLTLIFLTWTVPAVFGLSFLVYIEMFSVDQMKAILDGPIEITFCIGSVMFALGYFHQFAKPIRHYLEQPNNHNAKLLLQKLRVFPLHFWTVFLTYLVIAPFTVIYSAELYSDFKATPIDWFRINLVALIVSIIVGLPIFFLILDLFGKLVGRISFTKAHVTLKLKVFLIGALVPLLIDTMLVQYFWTRTGYFTRETFIVWLTLEILAIIGSLIFVKSISQSLKPLHSTLEHPTEFDEINFKDLQPCSTDELGVLTTSYRKLLMSLKAQHENLEKIVKHRTEALATSNRELESFSYSVSHDLRAPLRAINGFSNILMEENENKLDDESLTNLKRIIDNTSKMSHLIEDLLTLSRITSKEIKKEQVNLSRMAADALSLLKDMEPDRHIDVDIQSDLSTVGDSQLLKLAIDNLIENAWKYTGKQSEANIRMGYSPSKNAFYISDNGIGFDMKYNDRLFQVFQRLNNVEEFQGSGVGLATVKRVIDKHHGNIWAESEEGKGATFYFTI